MKKLFVFFCFGLLLNVSAVCQTANLKSFWSNVSFRYHTETMSGGMRSYLFGIAKKESPKYSETLALLESISTNTKFQDRIFLNVYLQEDANKESVGLMLANMCGSFSLGNPVADYICLKLSKDTDAKLLLSTLREAKKEEQKERRVQENPINTEEKINNQEIVETEVGFPGGQGALKHFIEKNLRVPEKAASNDIHGQVIVEFLINEEGKIQNAKVISLPLGYGLEEEALRVIQLLPSFIAATKNRIAVISRKKQIFNF